MIYTRYQYDAIFISAISKQPQQLAPEVLGTPRNVLLNYDAADPWATVARLAVGVSMLFGYPMQFAGARRRRRETRRVQKERPIPPGPRMEIGPPNSWETVFILNSWGWFGWFLMRIFGV